MEASKQRYYRFCIVTYNDENSIKKLLEQSNKWEYIVHDKDKTDKHIHINCSFEQQKSLRRVLALVEGKQNTFVQPMRDSIGAHQYLTHENESEEKYKYDVKDIKSNDLEHWTREKPDSNYEFITDLLRGELSYREMALKYGRDYIRNFKSYNNFVEAVREQERNSKEITVKMLDKTELQDI
ncbi:MAG: hypothetical protein J1F17_06880 [Oscillospiraceae bacterium]|nr:hypothetical protein [Oscillospiraceae bacterium]